MEHCRGQAAMVFADHVNSWWGVELLIPLSKHTKYYYFCVESMCRPMPTRGNTLPPPPWTQMKVYSPALRHGGDTAKSVCSPSRGRVHESSPLIVFCLYVLP
jgi:hypothetical protein